MEVIDIPIPVDRALYEEAVEIFVAMSRPYIESLYVVGNCRFPGQSDLDLLVVPNSNFAAPLHLTLRGRLPKRFDAIIQHDPFVVPRSRVEILRFVQLSNITLRYGDDLLPPARPHPTPTWVLCSVMEHVHCLWKYYRQQKTRKMMDARSGTRIINSFRFSLEQMEMLGLRADSEGYGVRIEQLRASLVETPSAHIVEEMFCQFEIAMCEAVTVINETLKTDVDSPSAIAELYQRQDLPIQGWDPSYASRRFREVQAYLDTLAYQNFWYGSIFNTDLYVSRDLSLRFRVFAKIARLLGQA